MSRVYLWVTHEKIMAKFINRFRPADIIGIIVILCGFYLLYKGIDTVVGGLVIAVVTYYFVGAKKHDKSEDN